MKHKNINAAFGSVLTTALFALALAGVAVAQGRYTGQYSRGDVDTIIRNVEDRADEFRRDFYNELDRSNLNASQRRIYRQQVENFENSTDRLRSNFNNDNTWWRSRSLVQAVISNSQPLNTTMNSVAFRRNVERQWNQLRNAVNRLADTFDLPGIAGGGWNGGPWNPGGGNNGGGQADNAPSWARGTWHWMNGPDRRMTIENNGRITLYNNGRTSYGSYRRNGTIFIDGIVSTISRNGNNIRTYNQATGESSDYSRNPWSGGGGGGGNVSRPPSWAVGNWRWANGPDRTMVIAANGDVTLYNQGMTSRGRYYNGTVTIDGLVSTVSRDGNRIRTYNQATGETSIYRRQ